MRLLFLSNVPSPYMVDFFNELGKQCELTVIFERKSSSERDKSWGGYQFNYFKGIILKGLPTAADAAFSPQVVLHIKKKYYDHIIVTNPATPTGVTAIEYMKLNKIPYILESEGSFAKDGKGLKERFKKHIMSGAKLYFSTTEKADEYFLTYGAIKEKLVKYPFTSLYEKEILESPLSEVEKRNLREKHGLFGNRIVVAAGRFVPLKYYHILIEAWRYMPADNTLYLIGSGPEKTKYEQIVQMANLKNVIFIPYQPKNILFDYFSAADLFVHPTSSDVWGLVINEAMACGLPVITTTMCIAGLALVKDYENGFIVPTGDITALANRMNYILSNDERRITMAQQSLRKIKWYTFENMVVTHIEILKHSVI